MPVSRGLAELRDVGAYREGQFMRTVFHDQLATLTRQLGEICGLAGVAMERATQALLRADLDVAEKVITDHDRIVAMTLRAEESALTLLALQQPVALTCG